MTETASARALILDARRRFEAAAFPDAASDARILVGSIAGLTTTQLLVDGERPLPPAVVEAIEQAVLRRLAHEPIYRILGARAFYGIELGLSRETLEPRPDTEILVDAMLVHVRRLAEEKGRVTILDLGTGTGAIALALLHECSEAHAVGVDISADALATAAGNAERLGLAARFETRAGPWFCNVPERFDIIVSNPPYIRTAVMEGLDPEVRQFDPPLALDGGPDGLDAYRAIAENAASHLSKGGLIGLEIGFDQRDEVVQVFGEKEFFLTEERRDLAGRDRVLVFCHSRN